MTDPLEIAIRLEKRRYAAMRAGNVTGLAALFSDELHYHHSNGMSDSKATYLDTVRTGQLEYLVIDHSEDAATQSGNTVAVFGAMRAEVNLRGVFTVINNRHLVVWCREVGTWRVLAYHPAPID